MDCHSSKCQVNCSCMLIFSLESMYLDNNYIMYAYFRFSLFSAFKSCPNCMLSHASYTKCAYLWSVCLGDKLNLEVLNFIENLLRDWFVTHPVAHFLCMHM